MVTEYMESDLHRMLQNPNVELTDKHIQYLMFQILCALKVSLAFKLPSE